MTNQIYVGIVFIVCCLKYIECSTPYGDGVDTCAKEWKKYGCYDEVSIDQSNMLASWRSYIKWGKDEYPKFMEKLACTCAREAKKANAAGFALFWYGQCFPVTSAEIGALGPKDKSDSCQKGDGTYALCTDNAGDTLCIGDDSAVYIYNMEPVDGGFSDWGSWSTCSRKCGTGSRSRNRQCNNPKPALGGDDCKGPSQENEACNNQPCAVDGGYGNWGGWTTCSKSCGGGLHKRSRVCNNPKPAHHGKPCSGKSTESSTCSTNKCPVNGGYGAWGNWGTCSATCGGGSQKRSRSCDSPPPSRGGNACHGPSEASRSCNQRKCITDGGYGKWTKWSECSVKCGGGQRIRYQPCKYPSICHRDRVQKELCNINQCPINGGYSRWSPWTKCTKQCGPGTRSRDRFCNNPKPEFGGKHCGGADKQEQVSNCNNGACPIDGNWTPWSSWSACSKKCGRGTRTKIRACTNPQPAYGGKLCSGGERLAQSCNIQRCRHSGGRGVWTQWGKWSTCSRKCGRGIQRSYRKCVVKTRWTKRDADPRRRRGRKRWHHKKKVVRKWRKKIKKGRRKGGRKRHRWIKRWRKWHRRRRTCRGRRMRKRRCNNKCGDHLPNCRLSHRRKYFGRRTAGRRGFIHHHVIAKIGKQYKVAFGFVAHKLHTGTILQIRARRHGRRRLGRRMPLVILKGNGRRYRGTLRVQLPISGKFNRDIIFRRMIIARKNYNLSISQRRRGNRYFVTVTLTGAGQRRSFTIRNTTPQYFRKVHVHATPGWRRRANASIHNLIISGICTR